jgi:maleate isomerase
MPGGYDYGRAGRIGIGTPQANPTVETEFAILVPPTASISVVRLTSRAPRPADRLRDYLLNLGDFLETFDTLKPDLFGFGCTASTYLVTRDEEQKVFADCEARFGYPVLGAADAIAWALDRIGARRIALLSPYPAELAEAAHAYWRGRGYTLCETGRAGALQPGADTRGIYRLGSADAAAALPTIDMSGLDAVVFTGTGMPSLPLIARVTPHPPLLSSNLCLAARICDRLGLGDLLDPASSVAHGWRERCRIATS